jgi:mediator of RNA polymerase II transcription subunit 21
MSGEVLTQLQDQLNTVSTMFFDFIGILQRDAPPVALADEPVVHAPAPGGFDVQQTTQAMAEQLTQEFKRSEELIQRIPDSALQEEEHYSTIRQLQQEHVAVSNELQSAVDNAEELLEQLQSLYAVLATHQLQQRTAT